MINPKLDRNVNFLAFCGTAFVENLGARGFVSVIKSKIFLASGTNFSSREYSVAFMQAFTRGR
jgi:hypothetical protein